MEKPRSEIDYIYDVIQNKISEEEYFEKRTDSGGKYSLQTLELEFMKYKPSLLKSFLLNFSLSGRFRILLKKEMLGMTRDEFLSKYGVNSNVVQALQGQYKMNQENKDAKIRDITAKGQPKIELLGTVAVFSRMPLSFLKEEIPSSTKWEVDYFKFIPDVDFHSMKKFIQYVINTEINALSDKTRHAQPYFSYVYDVRGIILHLDSESIYLRTSFWKRGGFVVEIFSKYNQLNHYYKLKNALKTYGPLKVGYCETVDPDHINIMIIVKSKAKIICLPAEFHEFE